MANSLYPSFKQKLLEGAIDNLTTANVVVGLANSTYVYSSAHDFFNDASTGVVSNSYLQTKSVTSGVFDAADTTLPAVGPLSACGQLILWINTTTAATSPLIAYIDTATGLPVTPNGGDITIQWDSGANKIFAL